MDHKKWIDFYKSMPKTAFDSIGSKLKENYPFRVSISSKISQTPEVQEWLNNVLPEQDFVKLFNSFHFKDETIAMQFKLTWK